MNEISITGTSTKAGPFIKWAGGKGALLPQLERHFPERDHYQRYFEPFLGGGAVFFHLCPTRSQLFDVNRELIEVYMTVRDNVEGLIEALAVHTNDAEHFYKVRSYRLTALSPVERAARFIFLNRTCYNGLFRVNRRGQFNVPFGNYRNPTICDPITLRSASQALARAKLGVADFEEAVVDARAGDFVYMDPPYAPLSTTSSFTSYTSGGFAWDEQVRLARVFRELTDRGSKVALSNSATPPIRHLYRDYHIHEVSARRSINSNGNGRGAITELLVTNYSATELGLYDTE